MKASRQKPKLRLIVADDAAFIREIVRTLAQSNGIELVGEAADGFEAIQLAEELRPDLILMDLIMPRKNGIEAAQEIIAKIPEMKIVAFSTADHELMVMRALAAGCCNYIVKPFEGHTLLEVIRKSVGTTAA